MLPHSNGPQPHLASVPVLDDAPAKVITGALSASCVDVGDEENQEKKRGRLKRKNTCSKLSFQITSIFFPSQTNLTGKQHVKQSCVMPRKINGHMISPRAQQEHDGAGLNIRLLGFYQILSHFFWTHLELAFAVRSEVNIAWLLSNIIKYADQWRVMCR